MSSADEFLTVHEVATLLKLNQATIRSMVDRGELKAVRVGSHRVRIRRSDLDAFLAAGDRPRARDELAVLAQLLKAAEQGQGRGRTAALRALAEAAEAFADETEAPDTRAAADDNRR